ncbi:MAG: hypothetical protein VB949_06910 [Pseudomonadales bacterium]|jgi:hypothetical protein
MAISGALTGEGTRYRKLGVIGCAENQQLRIATQAGALILPIQYQLGTVMRVHVARSRRR